MKRVFEKIVAKLSQYSTDFIVSFKLFGLSIAVEGLLFHLTKFGGSRYFSSLEKQLLSRYPFLKEVDCSNYLQDSVGSTYSSTAPIWTMWWQGEDSNAPDVVKTCLKSLKKNSGDHPVIVIDKNNYLDYVDVPDYITSLVNNGKLNLTKLSNYIRCELLYKYGGAWIDSTCYITKQLPSEIFSDPFYTIPVHGKDPVRDWTTFFLASHPNNPVFATIIRFYNEFYREFIGNFDYFVFDIVLSVIYKNNSSVKVMFDNVRSNNSSKNYILDNFGKAFSECNLPDENYLYKVTYKESFPKTKQNGEQTLYGWFIEQ